MVEGQIGGEGVNIEPLGEFGVVAGFNAFRTIGDDSHIGDGDLSASWVAAGFTEGVQLLEFDAGEACFLGQFSSDGVVKLLIDTDKAAGDCPLAFEGVVFALDEQKFNGAGADGKNDGVDSYHRSRPIVNVFAFFIHNLYRC